MADKIKIRRGLFADLPDLDEGELGYVKDRGTVYIGTSTDNNILLNPILVEDDGYSLDGYLYPAVDNVHGLGTSTNRWSSVSVGPGSIHLIARDTDSGYSSNNEYKIGIDPTTGSLQFSNENSVLLELTSSGFELGATTFSSGTNLIPSIAWEADADGTGSGLFRPGANQVGVTLDGTHQFSFASSGGGVPQLRANTALLITALNGTPYAQISSGNIQFASSGGTLQSIISGLATDGNILLTNAAGSSFGLLQFGGVTSAFPAIKRNGTNLEFVLADNTNNVLLVGDGIRSTYNYFDLSGSSSGGLAFNNTGSLSWSSTSSFGASKDLRITRSGPGNMLLSDTSGGFNLLQLGGITSDYPAIKRSGTSLLARTAADDGYAYFYGPLIVPTTERIKWDTKMQISSPSDTDIKISNSTETIDGTIRLSSFQFSFYRTGGGVLADLQANGLSTTYVASTKFRSDDFGSGTTYVVGATLASDASLAWSNSTTASSGTYDLQLLRHTSGNLTLSNGAGNFGLLQFGGNTSAYPAIKKQNDYLGNVGLSFRKADDTSYVGIIASSISDDAYGAHSWSVNGRGIEWDNAMSLSWGPNASVNIDGDTAIFRKAQRALALANGGAYLPATAGVVLDFSSADLLTIKNFANTGGADLNVPGAASVNGQGLTIKATVSLSGTLSGASVTVTNAMPQGVFMLGITARVITEITGATSWNIGIATDNDSFGASLALTVGTTVDIPQYTVAPTSFRTSATPTDIVITAVGSNFTGGEVRISVHYIDLTPPTS